MNNLSIYIIVEGKTEQTFVRSVLAPTLANKKMYLHPVIIGKPGQKGGNVSFERDKRDIGLLLKQRRKTYVSTMFDFSQIDPKWPGRKEVQKKTRKEYDSSENAENHPLFSNRAGILHEPLPRRPGETQRGLMFAVGEHKR